MMSVASASSLIKVPSEADKTLDSAKTVKEGILAHTAVNEKENKSAKDFLRKYKQTTTAGATSDADALESGAPLGQLIPELTPSQVGGSATERKQSTSATGRQQPSIPETPKLSKTAELSTPIQNKLKEGSKDIRKSTLNAQLQML